MGWRRIRMMVMIMRTARPTRLLLILFSHKCTGCCCCYHLHTDSSSPLSPLPHTRTKSHVDDDDSDDDYERLQRRTAAAAAPRNKIATRRPPIIRTLLYMLNTHTSNAAGWCEYGRHLEAHFCCNNNKKYAVNFPHTLRVYARVTRAKDSTGRGELKRGLPSWR